MARNIKAFGIAFFMLSVTGAMAVPVAAAEESTLSWDPGTVTLTVEADPTTPSQTFKLYPGVGNLEFTCNEVHGQVKEITGTGSSTITMQEIVYSDSGTTPGVKVCTGNSGAGAKVKLNECRYVFHVNATEGIRAEGKAEGTIKIECPAGKAIEVETTSCLSKIPEQTVGPVYYRTLKPGPREEVTVEVLAGTVPGAAHNKTITYSTEGSLCGTHKNEKDGTLTATFLINGYNSQVQHNEATQTSITVT